MSQIAKLLKLPPLPGVGDGPLLAASLASEEGRMRQHGGVDNYGRPKAKYIAKLAACSDEELAEECDKYIWLSAYAANNPRSDYHWMVDACYDECERRGKPKIYAMAHKRQVAAARGY
jgi:hypothetical protein